MSWKSWSPFQSTVVKEIYANMNSQEFDDLYRHASMCGFLNGISVGIVIFVFHKPFSIATILAVFLIILQIVSQRRFNKKLKAFLCSTDWAKSRGYTPESLKLYSFRILKVDKG